MIEITFGGVAQTAIFVPRHELVPEVKRVIGLNFAAHRWIATGTKRFASPTRHSMFDGRW
jgi:hypothetical protein